MANVIKLNKGLDIPLKGIAEKVVEKQVTPKLFAVKPTDFPGIRPKMMVRIDDEVRAGTPLFFDKYNPDVLFSSPVSGRVVAINRGERRKILEVVIKSDTKMTFREFKKADPLAISREDIVNNLLKAGMWPLLKQRPYGIIPRPEDEPRSIFISGFDTAPLAPDYCFIMNGKDIEFQTGINALSRLTKGKVHLNLDAGQSQPDAYLNAKNVQINYFSGPHPAGNPGIQIHHIDPVHKNGTVWYLRPQEVVIIGRLFLNGVADFSKIIALTGSEVLKPRYYLSITGASVSDILKDNVKDGHQRHISGNVLTGTKVPVDGFLGFYDSQVTVIPEGNYYKFMGWASPGLDRFSQSRSFFSWLMPGRKYRLDTNYNGGQRAYVMTGEYDKVLPMDIFPQQLVKAIMVEDIDRMENLGIYEVVEEDMALCEFVCTSKTEVQSVLRKGIELMIKETS